MSGGWRATLDQALAVVEVAGVYVEDGALHTAADRLRKAADLMALAARQRDAASGGERR